MTQGMKKRFPQISVMAKWGWNYNMILRKESKQNKFIFELFSKIISFVRTQEIILWEIFGENFFFLVSNRIKVVFFGVIPCYRFGIN